MLIATALLLVSAIVTYLASEYFVNGVEWTGHKTGIAQGAVGSVLAAFGTALPESVVTLMAVVFGKPGQGAGIGMGAALGGPLVLATIAYGVAGFVLLARREPWSANQPLTLDNRRLSRDQAWFIVIFLAKVALGYVVFSFKPWLAVLFVLAYLIYVRSELKHTEDETDAPDLEPLMLQPKRSDPALGMVLLQTLGALVVVFLASGLFVRQIEVVAPYLGLPATLVALLLSPIATELPETMNAIIWIRQGKLHMALANISGSMMVQATIPSALGIYFTPWLFDHVLGWSAFLTLFSISLLWAFIRFNRLTPLRLAACAGIYVVFVCGVVWLQWGNGA